MVASEGPLAQSEAVDSRWFTRWQARLARHGARKPNKNQIKQRLVVHVDDFEFLFQEQWQVIGVCGTVDLRFYNH